MKKMFFLCLMTLLTWGAQAQTLEGSWATLLSNDDDEMQATLVLAFVKPNDAAMVISFEGNDKDMGKIEFQLAMGGTYVQHGNKLTLNLDKDSSEVEMKNWEPTEEAAALFEQDPDTKKAMINAMTELLNTQKDSLVSAFGREEMTIVSLEADEMVLQSVDEKITFKRVE